MLGVVQESVRLFLTHTQSHFGHSCPGCWWTIFGFLYTLFSVIIKGFTLNGAETNGCLCLCLGVKDLEPSLNQNWEELYSNWLQGKGRLIEMVLGIQDTRIRAIQRSQWLEARIQKSSILFCPRYFLSVCFDGLSLATFFLKASTPSEGVQANCPRVLNPEGIS